MYIHYEIAASSNIAATSDIAATSISSGMIAWILSSPFQASKDWITVLSLVGYTTRGWSIHLNGVSISM